MLQNILPSQIVSENNLMAVPTSPEFLQTSKPPTDDVVLVDVTEQTPTPAPLTSFEENYGP